MRGVVAKSQRAGRAVGRALGRGSLETTTHSVGRLHGQGEGGLEVGLVEARVDEVGVERLELAVEVDALVAGVHEAVQALALVLVGHRRPTRSVFSCARSGSVMRVVDDSLQVEGAPLSTTSATSTRGGVEEGRRAGGCRSRR